MLEHLQNPLFPVFILLLVLSIGYVLAHDELIPGFVFMLFAAMGVLMVMTNIGQISMLRAVMTPLLGGVLVMKSIRRSKRLPVMSWVLLVSYMLIIYISGTLNHIPLVEYRGSLGVLLLAFVVSVAPNTNKSIRYFLIAVLVWGLVNMAAIMSAWLGFNAFQGYSLFNDHGRAVGLMRHSTMMGVYFALSVIAAQVLYYQATTRLERLIFLWAGIVLMLGLLGSLSRGAFGDWLAAFLYLQYKVRSMRLGAILGIVLTAVVIALIASFFGIYDLMFQRFATIQDDASANARIPLVLSSLKTWMQSPIFGNGIGWKDTTTILKEAHNTFTQVLVESGLIGFTLFMTLMWSGTRSLFRQASNWREDPETSTYYLGLAAMLCAIIFDGVTHSFDFLIPFWILLGFGLMVRRCH